MGGAQNKTVKKVWSGYECPACFGIFRVVKGNEHREAICPRCETILRLVEAPELPVHEQGGLPAPVETLASGSATVEAVSALSGPSQSVAPADPSAEEQGVVKKRRKKIKSSLDPDWERTDHARRREEAWKLPVILLIGGIFILAGALVTVEFLSSKKEASQVSVVEASSLGLDREPELPEEKVVASTVDVEGDREMILEAVRLFLEAESVEELLLMVRPARGIASKIRRHYLSSPYKKTKVRRIAEDGAFSMVDELVSVNVVMDDFSVRPIALEKVEDRFLVDWESWIGHSEMSWEQFFEIRPQRGRVFRVLVSPVDYYNFGFSDDGEWRSFQVTSADRETVVYGYVPSSSPKVNQLMPIDPEVREAAFIVRLRYPEEPGTEDQVLIEEVLCSGWVLARE